MIASKDVDPEKVAELSGLMFGKTPHKNES
jgi:hypothetical protein